MNGRATNGQETRRRSPRLLPYLAVSAAVVVLCDHGASLLVWIAVAVGLGVCGWLDGRDR